MELIKSVEISYFRSIYKESLNKCGDLNVVFGKNDVGKSNVLRALNLFFNGETNPGQQFNFSVDFSDARRNESKRSEDVRKFVYVKITFRTPQNWKKSLGEEFYVKKSWNISRGSEHSIEYSSHISKRNKIYLTRFLNTIRFFYIPAVKDRSIFAQILSEMHEIIASNEKFQGSLNDFAGTLQEVTNDLTESISKNLQISSAIAPPQNIVDLFRSLDFETGVDKDHRMHSLILQRGDGIQARHLPELLNFISDLGAFAYSIWGFEEPENSLELMNATKEAERFRSIAKENSKQIFVTSHSPGFYMLNDSEVRKYFVSSKINHDIRCSTLSSIDDTSKEKTLELMGDDFILESVSEEIQKLKNRNEVHKAEIQSIKGTLSDAKKPILFLEGQADAIVFGKLIEILNSDIAKDIKIEGLRGTPSLKALAAEGDAFRLAANGRKVVVVTDWDSSAREILKRVRRKVSVAEWLNHPGNLSQWRSLPETKGFSSFHKSYGLPADQKAITIETIWPLDFLRTAEKAGFYATGPAPFYDYRQGKKHYEIVRDISDKDEKYLFFEPSHETKLSFANYISNNLVYEEILPEVRTFVTEVVSALED